MAVHVRPTATTARTMLKLLTVACIEVMGLIALGSCLILAAAIGVILS